ncbi:hypothetical protein LP419_02845 [Massilia sp. H-1]|nr:hypothetical protein LP419_02845 [Massilia sp. H-1]
MRITAARSGSQLHVTVENDVDEDLPAAGARGIGLANVRQRLATLYGHEAAVSWTREQQSFRVALVLPAETTES